MHLRRLRHCVLLLGLVAVAACGGSDTPEVAGSGDGGGGAPATTAAANSGPTSSSTSSSTGSSTGSSTDRAAEGSAPVAAAPTSPTTGLNAAAVLPAVEVVDVATGDKLTLASLVASDKPTLFWAWAPH